MTRIQDEPPHRRQPGSARAASRWTAWARALADRHARVPGRFPWPTMALATLSWPTAPWRPGRGAACGPAARSLPATTAAGLTVCTIRASTTSAGLIDRAVPATVARSGALEPAPWAPAEPIDLHRRLLAHPWGPVALPVPARAGTVSDRLRGLWTTGSLRLRRGPRSRAGGPAVGGWGSGLAGEPGTGGWRPGFGGEPGVGGRDPGPAQGFRAGGGDSGGLDSGGLWMTGFPPPRRRLPSRAGARAVGGWSSGVAGSRAVAARQDTAGRLAGRWQRVELRAEQVSGPSPGLGREPGVADGAARGGHWGRPATHVVAAWMGAAPAQNAPAQERHRAEEPARGWDGPAGRDRPGAPARPVDLDLLADQVVRQIDRRIVAHRERLGRI